MQKAQVGLHQEGQPERVHLGANGVGLLALVGNGRIVRAVVAVVLELPVGGPGQTGPQHEPVAHAELFADAVFDH